MVSQVSEQLSAGVATERGIQPTYGYYRQSNGWITFSTITRLEKLKYMEQGWISLDQYGTFDASPYVVSHPLEALFMFGGAHELPVEQVVQMGLYMDPPLVPRCRQHLTQYHRAHTWACWAGAQPVEFPQLVGIWADLKPFPCEFCDRELPTVEAKTQHQSVAHKESLGNIQTGRALGDSVAQAMGHTPVVATPMAPTEASDQQLADMMRLMGLTPETLAALQRENAELKATLASPSKLSKLIPKRNRKTTSKAKKVDQQKEELNDDNSPKSDVPGADAVLTGARSEHVRGDGP